MAESKYVFFVGCQRGVAQNRMRVVVKFARNSRSALEKRGLPEFIQRVLKEISEVALIEFEPDPMADIVDITLKGDYGDRPDSRAMTALGVKVTQKLDQMVVSIVEGGK